MEAFQKEGIFHSRLDRQIYTPHTYGHILERMYMGPRRTRIYTGILSYYAYICDVIGHIHGITAHMKRM